MKLDTVVLGPMHFDDDSVACFQPPCWLIAVLGLQWSHAFNHLARKSVKEINNSHRHFSPEPTQ
jgi:hypothetical protein